MAIQKFKTRSGAELQIDDLAEFEATIALVETVKKIMRSIFTQAAAEGKTPEQMVGIEVSDAVQWNPEVRRAAIGLFPWVIYDGARMSEAMLNDPRLGHKVRGDYQEIISHIVEVISKPFFQNPSSGSTTREEGATDVQQRP